MKKALAIVAFVAALFVAGNVQAQEKSIYAGYAPEQLTQGNTTTSMNGFFLGANYNLNLVKDLGLSLGLQARLNTESGSSNVYGVVTAKHSTTQFLLDIPVLLNYGFKLNKDLKLTVFAGPTINFGLSAKTKVEGNVLGIGGESTFNWYDPEGMNFGRFNLSGTGGLAIDFRQFRLFGGYSYGFLDVDRSSSTAKTAAPFFGIGYKL